MTRWLRGTTTTTCCTIEVAHTDEAFHAHIVLDGDIEIGPGDRVQVLGAPVHVKFGETMSERRDATIEAAGPLLRFWTRFAARFALSELYEVSFTTRRAL
jgi:hypothetical protein